MKRDYATKELYFLGLQGARDLIRDEIYPALYSPRERQMRNPNADPSGKVEEGKEHEGLFQMNQLGQLLCLIGLIIELHEAIRYGLVGKLPMLFKLITPWFAGTNSHNYARELLTWSLLELAATKETFDALIDALIVPAKLNWFIATDGLCEQLVRQIKETFVDRGGAFKISNLLENTSQITEILYGSKQAVVTAHLSPEQIKTRGKHYNPSMQATILNLTTHMLESGILSGRLTQTVSQPDTYRLGTEKVSLYDYLKLRPYMFDARYVESDGENQEMDLAGVEVNAVGAFDDDPDALDEFPDIDSDAIELAKEDHQHTLDVARKELEQLLEQRKAAALRLR